MAASQASGMAGKERAFIRGFLLAVVTLGLYGIYWLYKAHDEILTEHKVDEFPTGKFVLALIPIVNIVGAPLYFIAFNENVNGARHKLGLQEAMSNGEVLAWIIAGFIIPLIPVIVLFYKLQTAINEVWQATGTGAGGSGQAPGAQPQAQ